MPGSSYANLQVAGTASINGVNPTLLAGLNQLAAKYGPIQIISGYRSPGYSAKVGGYANDPHTRGEAVDAYIGGKPIGEVIPLNVLQQVGLQGGNQPGFYQGKTDPEHVQIPGSGVDKSLASPALNGATGVAATGNTPPSSAQSPWPQTATLAYTMAQQAGLNPQQAKDFATVQYGESGFNPSARNKDSGAAGLYQLLSPGYVQKANQLGGVYDPRANIGAILPDYVSYYKSHPFQPGAAGAAVERSGEGAGYYAQGYQHLPGMPTGSPVATPPPGSAMVTPPAAATPIAPAPPDPRVLAAQQTSTLGNQLAQQLLGSAQQMLNGGTPNLQGLFAAAKGFQQARASLTRTAPLGATTPLSKAAALKA